MRYRVLLPWIVCLMWSSALADMMEDSPVTFPERGALPAKYPPDRPTGGSEATEPGYYIFGSPVRSLAQIAQIQAEMPSGEFTAPACDWTHLRRTRRTLTEGGELRLLALGDSIINDTMRSGWVAMLQEAYPKAKITATVYVRGGGGCQHYKEDGRIANTAEEMLKCAETALRHLCEDWSLVKSESQMEKVLGECQGLLFVLRSIVDLLKP